MRLFLGIAPDAATREAIAQGLSRVEAALGASASAFKWTRRENLHVTLHFLGEVPAARLEELRAVIGEPLQSPPFAAAIGRCGAFPARGPVRVIWVGVEEGADTMWRLHAEFAERLRRLRIGVEDRPFSPHFTLARARDRQHARGIREALDRVDISRSSWHVEAVTLFQSDLSGASPRYEAQIDVPLAIGPRRTS